MKIKTVLFILLLGSITPAVADDYIEAEKWLHKAAAEGDAEAQYFLGKRYRKGQSVPKDDAEALKWYRRAAEQGHAGAQYRLGFMYFAGVAVPQDDTKAYMWYSLAAASGDKNGILMRNTLANEITPAAITEGQRLARECIASDYKNCP